MQSTKIRKNRTHNHRPRTNESQIQPHQPHPPPPPPAIHKQPENPTQSIREPAGEQRRDQAKQVIERRDRLGNHPRARPQPQHDQRPRAEARPAASRHAVRAAEQAHVDVFGGHVAVDDACDHDGRDGDAVRDFAQERGGGAEGGRGD